MFESGIGIPKDPTLGGFKEYVPAEMEGAPEWIIFPRGRGGCGPGRTANAADSEADTEEPAQESFLTVFGLAEEDEPQEGSEKKEDQETGYYAATGGGAKHNRWRKK